MNLKGNLRQQRRESMHDAELDDVVPRARSSSSRAPESWTPISAQEVYPLLETNTQNKRRKRKET